MGIFKAQKAGSQNQELIVGRLTGVMDLKIFYKGKHRGKRQTKTPIQILFQERLFVREERGRRGDKCLSSPGHNACADQPCSLLCLPQPGHKHTCVCPDGVPMVTMPEGELQCKCPFGYQLRNKTCVKTGETRQRP